MSNIINVDLTVAPIIYNKLFVSLLVDGVQLSFYISLGNEGKYIGHSKILETIFSQVVR